MIRTLVINVLLFLIVGAIVPGFEIATIGAAIGGAIVFGFLNVFVKPILSLLSLPLNFLTLGLFHFLVNGLVLYMASGFINGFVISSFWVAVFSSIILGGLQSVIEILRSN